MTATVGAGARARVRTRNITLSDKPYMCPKFGRKSNNDLAS